MPSFQPSGIVIGRVWRVVTDSATTDALVSGAPAAAAASTIKRQARQQHKPFISCGYMAAIRHLDVAEIKKVRQPKHELVTRGESWVTVTRDVKIRTQQKADDTAPDFFFEFFRPPF